jgi:hypothetical protein
VVGESAKDFRDAIDGEAVEEDAVHELDVGVFAQLALELGETVLVEVLD